MKRAKLVKESLNNDKFTVDQVIQSMKDYFDDIPTESEVVGFILNNWESVTGTSEEEMFAEQEFPDIILEIIDRLGLDYQEFSQEFGSQAEMMGGDRF